MDWYIVCISIKTSSCTDMEAPSGCMIIFGTDVPLQHIWDQFIALDENNVDFTCLLSMMLVNVGPDLTDYDEETINSVGYTNSETLWVFSNCRKVDHLACDHDEADTLNSASHNSWDGLQFFCFCFLFWQRGNPFYFHFIYRTYLYALNHT